MRNRYFILAVFVVTIMAAWAQAPNKTGDYYKGANGKKGYALKTALHKAISKHTTLNYKTMHSHYTTTDKRPDGKIRDRYSKITNYTLDNVNKGSNSIEGGQLNKEHSFPKSWFNEATPMTSDIFHVIPSDAKVNNERSNYPFGENKGEIFSSSGGYSKVGLCTVEGYSGKCFEPNDEWKGDFARIYFYMVTCYEDVVKGWSSAMLDGSSDRCFTPWALKMLMRWAADDPVSQIEVDRNNAVYVVQDNRNPFVDYPGLEEYIWGSKTDVAFNYEDYDGAEPIPYDPEEPDTPETPDTPDTPAEGEVEFLKVASAADLETGKGYLMVYEQGNMALAASSTQYSEYRTCTPVTIAGEKIITKVDEKDKPRMLILGGKQGAYTFFDTVEKVYLAYTGSKNNLNASTNSQDEAAQWQVEFSGGNAVISNCAAEERIIYFNASSPRFACYSSSPQEQIALYEAQLKETPDDPESTAISTMTAKNVRTIGVYTLDGRLAGSSIDSLPHGVYLLRTTGGTVKILR